MMKSKFQILSLTLFMLLIVVSCSKTAAPTSSSSEPVTTKTATHQPPTTTTIEGSGEVDRDHLTYDGLIHGFEFDSPMDETAVTIPLKAGFPVHKFEGRLELFGEDVLGDTQVLRGELESQWSHLPEFEYAFVQKDSYLIPVQRGSITTNHPYWNYILGPGRVWQERGDQGYSRASFPFSLIVKGGNTTFNGTMTFLFDDQNVSKVWYQITQETTTNARANFWGLLDATYHHETIANSNRIKNNFTKEVDLRIPTRPIEALEQDFPGVDLSAFGYGVTPEHMTWYGFIINGINYVGGCKTRFGIYPYCETMRATSYSTAKSAFVSMALMRLMMKYDPDVANLLIKDYVPEAAESQGNWENVTFNNTLDMSTGNYISPGNQVDENGSKMNEFFETQPYNKRIAVAFDWPNANEPGKQWVYHTSDTFILTRALHNYLINKEGPDSDIFEFVIEEIYHPIGLGPGAFTTMRTADNNWGGQAEGGYGLWWIPDDIAKISSFLLNKDGQIDGIQVLDPQMLSASLQRNPKDRGVGMSQRSNYNNAFWAFKYDEMNNFDCEFWVPMMLGVSGNVVALMPNGTIYYYFSDNQEFTWDAAVKESGTIIPFCP